METFFFLSRSYPVSCTNMDLWPSSYKTSKIKHEKQNFIYIQFLLKRKHIASPLQRLTYVTVVYSYSVPISKKTHCISITKTDVCNCCLFIFSSYIKENTLHLHYKDWCNCCLFIFSSYTKKTHCISITKTDAYNSLLL
jgi:hypothetical protein